MSMMEKINIKKLFSTIFLFIFFTNLFILLLTAKTVSANDDKIIQFYLNQLGLNSGAVDGQPGIKTKAALKRFYALNPDLKAKKLGFDAKNDVLNVAKDENIVGFHYGLCSHSNQNIRGPSEEYSDTFNLSEHKRVVTDLPRYRSYSFGSTDKNVGSVPAPEIKGVGDINNDGIDDIVIDYYETSIPPLFYLGTPNGQFQKLNFSDPKAARRHIRNGEFVDINSDGFLDFVGFTTGDPGQRWIEEGYDTDGKSIPRGEADILLINENGQGFRHIKIPEIRKNDWNHGGTSADLNGDAFIDIIPLSEGEKEKTAAVINEGGERFVMGKYEYSKEISYFLTSDVDSADFNNDGHDDLVFAITNTRPRTPKDNNAVGTIRVLYGDGDFDFRDNLETKFGTIWLSDEDGKIIVDNFTGKISAGAGHDLSKILTGSGNVEAIDVDMDGNIDILEGQYFTVSGLWSGSGFKYYRNTGECFYDATDEFFPNQKTNRNFKSNIFTRYIHNFYQNDINNDGLNDIILQTDGRSSDWTRLQSNKGFPYVFINQGNQKFLPVSYLDTDVSELIGLDDIVPGDFNGDGLIDILGIYSNDDRTEIRAFYKKKPTDWSKIEDEYAGNYEVNWYFGNVNDGGKLKLMGSEALTLKKGIGSFSGTGQFQPSANLRKDLKVTYEPDGEVQVKGKLDLFEPSRSYVTVFNGSLNDQSLQTSWEEGDLMVIKFKNKKEFDQEVKNLELSEEQLECNISILRNLDDGQNETKIGHAIMTTSNGSVELSQLELRTGTKDYLNTLSDEAELYLSKDGKIVGRVLLPTAFGNNRLDMLNFGSNFIPMIGGNGPEGRHSYQVEPGLDISIFVEWCFDN
jgi:hypothetical protein